MRWVEKTLGDICDQDDGLIQTGPFGSQLHQSDYQDEGIPFVMPKDISEGSIDLASVARISEESANRLARHKLKVGAILMPRRGAINKRAFITEDEEGFVCGSGCIKIELNGAVLDSKYLYYFLDQSEMITWIEQHGVGATMLNLNSGIIERIPIRYPALSVQRRIASILSAYDDLIANNRRRIQLLEQAAREIYKEWFVRLRFPGHEHTRVVEGVPEGWGRKSLADICDDIRDSIEPEQVESDTPYIGLEHIPKKSITLSEWGQADDVTSSKFRFIEGDILFGKIRPYFHKVGFTLTNGITSIDTIVIRAKDKKFYAYLLMLVSSDEFVAVASKTMREGSKMPRADWNFMRQYPVLIPPLPILSEFDKIIDDIAKQLKTLALQSKKLQQARDLLLPRLMSGAITPNPKGLRDL